MNKVILVIGLPASGKTTWAKNHAETNGLQLIDDPKDFEQDVLPHLMTDVDIIITDPYLCIDTILTACINKIHAVKEIEIVKMFFENDPDKALRNAMRRDDKPVTKLIKQFTQRYNPEKIDLLIYEQ